MKNERDDGRTHAVEDGCNRLQVAEIDIESAQGSYDDEVRQDEGPAAGPGAPEATAQVGNVDSHLNCERPGQRLTNRDRLAHLLLGEPFAVVDQFAFHLADQRNRAAKTEATEPQEVAHQFADPAFWNDCRRRHFRPRSMCDVLLVAAFFALASSPTARTSRVKRKDQLFAVAVLSSAARNPLASFKASSLAQKWRKNSRGCSSSM